MDSEGSCWRWWASLTRWSGLDKYRNNVSTAQCDWWHWHWIGTGRSIGWRIDTDFNGLTIDMLQWSAVEMAYRTKTTSSIEGEIGSIVKLRRIESYPLGVLYVLKINCGPIHRRRCGPLDVTISTCDSQRSSQLSMKSDSLNFSFGSIRFLSNQLSSGNGGWISIDASFRSKFHWARASTCNSMAESSFCRAAGMPWTKKKRLELSN